MNLSFNKLERTLVLLGGGMAWISILGFLFLNPEGKFLLKYKFVLPYTYILSLVFVLFVCFFSMRNRVNDYLPDFYIYLFNFLCICGVLLGVLLVFVVLGMTHVPVDYQFYGGHFFFSSIVFYMAFFNCNKKAFGVGSKILYWLFIFLGLFAFILYLVLS